MQCASDASPAAWEVWRSWRLGSGVQESHPAKCIHKQRSYGSVNWKKWLLKGSLLGEETQSRPLRDSLACATHCVHTSHSTSLGKPVTKPADSAAPHQDLSHHLALEFNKAARSDLSAPNTLGISSDCVLDPTMLEMPTSPLAAGVEQQDQIGVSGRHSLQEAADSALCGALCPAGSLCHPWPWDLMIVPSTREHSPGCRGARGQQALVPKTRGGHLRSSSMGPGSRVGSPSRAKAAEPRGPDRAGALNGAFSLLERRLAAP